MVPTVVVPVMTLGNCVFLPQQLMPLRIFEPRYRLMLKEALAGNRMFAVSQLDEDNFHEIANDNEQMYDEIEAVPINDDNMVNQILTIVKNHVSEVW